MVAHRYWRLYVSANNGGNYVEIAELEFRETAGVPQVPTGGTALRSSAFSASSTYQASNAFDGSNSTRWRAAGNAYEWIGYDFGSGNEIEPVEILLGAYTSTTTNTPKFFALEYSDDGVTWNLYSWFEEESSWANGEARTLSIVVSSAPDHITQVPVILVDNGSRELRVTQAAINVVTLPVQPARITQVPIVVPNLPRPVPLPVALVPETPVTEVWSFLAVVNSSDNGKEQRVALRNAPRYSLRFSFLILGDYDRRQVFDLLYKYQGIEFIYPLFHYSTPVEKTPSGAMELYFDVTQTDMRAGEQISIYDPFAETLRYAEIATVEADGVTLAEPLPEAILAGCYVAPATPFRIPELVGLRMNTVAGEAIIRIESTRPRAFQRIDGSSLLTMLGNTVVLDRRPMNDVSDELDHGVRWSDSGTSIPAANVKWRAALAVGNRRYRYNRFKDSDYWRAFADAMKGRRGSFLLPTFFDDLPLAAAPALNAAQIVTSNIQADEYLSNRAYKFLRIERMNGKVTFHNVVDKKMNYTVEGDPVSIDVRIAPSLGNTAGDNIIKLVSFAILSRLNDDNITIEHGQADSVISIPFKAVNQ